MADDLEKARSIAQNYFGNACTDAMEIFVNAILSSREEKADPTLQERVERLERIAFPSVREEKAGAGDEPTEILISKELVDARIAELEIDRDSWRAASDRIEADWKKAEAALAELRGAFAAAEYQPGDCPIVPVKIAAFMDKARALLSPEGEAKDEPSCRHQQNGGTEAVSHASHAAQPARDSDPVPATDGRGIYIASKVKHGPRWQAYRASGVPIISTWIDESGEGQTSDYHDLWQRCIAEAVGAAVTVIYHEDGEVLKGAFVEVGAALSHGRCIIVVGDPPGTWVHHRNVSRVATIDEAFALAAARPPASREDRAMSEPTREDLVEIGARAAAKFFGEDWDEIWERREMARRQSYRDEATAILDAILPRVLEGVVEAAGALETADSWLMLHARHVGSCLGKALCTCGLEAVRAETGSALLDARSVRQWAEKMRGVG